MNRKTCLALIIFCGLPSVAMFQRFAEVAAASTGLQAGSLTGLLLAGWSAFAVLLLKFVVPKLNATSHWPVHPDILFLLFLGLLILLQLMVYPLADSGQLGFYSDRDEAIDIGARRLLAGEFPYSCRAVSGIHLGCPEQGNLILPLPGALVLSLPFMFLGGSATQVFFWLTLLYLISRHISNSPRQACTYVLTIFALSPILLAEILTGGDLISNTLAVSSLTLLALNARTVGKQMAFGFMLGIALSWRAHFLLICFPLLAFHAVNGQIRPFLRIATATALGFALVTVPIALWDPAQFTPVQSSEKLSRFSHLLPHASVVAPLLAALGGLVLGAKARNQTGLLRACAVTAILPVLAAVALNSIEVGHPSLLFFGWYTLSGLVFGTVGTMTLPDLHHTARQLPLKQAQASTES